MTDGEKRCTISTVGGGVPDGETDSGRVLMDSVDILRQWVEESHNIVFFGGAGVSTEYVS